MRIGSAATGKLRNFGQKKRKHGNILVILGRVSRSPVQRQTIAGLEVTQIPTEPLIPGNSLITATPEEGRALAITIARHSVHSMQHELEVLKSGRERYAHDPFGLIAAGHVIAVEFATIAAANEYWRGPR